MKNRPASHHSRVYAAVEDPNGVLWVGTDGGVVSRVVDGTVTSFTQVPGLARAYVRAFLEDAAGSLWIGTSGNGLYRYREGTFAAFRERDGLWSDKAFAIFDRQGDLWLTCDRDIFGVSKRAVEELAAGRAH